MYFKTVNEKTYKSKSNINKNETLLIIPNKIMLNTDNALNLLGSKKLKKQYENFVNEKTELKPNPSLIFNTTEKNPEERSFLAYILYLIKQKPKTYQKTKFYDFYKFYFDSFDTDMSKLALFYDEEQFEILLGTYTYQLINYFRSIYQKEYELLKNKYLKHSMDYDEYLKYRIFTINKAYNISGKNTMVPFLDLFKTDYYLFNANFTIEKNGDIRIYSTRNINKNEEIILAEEKMINTQLFLFKGKTYEQLIDEIPSYIVDAFSANTYYTYQFKEEQKDYLDKFKIDLSFKDFDKRAIKLYKSIKEVFGKQNDGSHLFYYDVLRTNLAYFKETFEYDIEDKILDVFYKADDRVNIHRIRLGEQNLVNKCYNKVDAIFDEIRTNEKEYDRKHKNDDEEEKKENKEKNKNKEGDL